MIIATRTLLIGLLFSITLATPLQASERLGERVLGAVFSEIERQAIGDYYAGRYGSKKKHKGKGKNKGLPPGLAKRDRLPPGLEKQLQRNGTLPPGLAKRELPDSLHRMLPPRSRDYERVLVDNNVLLIETATGLILDILRDVF